MDQEYKKKIKNRKNNPKRKNSKLHHWMCVCRVNVVCVCVLCVFVAVSASLYCTSPPPSPNTHTHTQTWNAVRRIRKDQAAGHVCACLRVCVCKRACVCTCACMRVHMCVCIRGCMYICVHTCMCAIGTPTFPKSAQVLEGEQATPGLTVPIQSVTSIVGFVGF